MMITLCQIEKTYVQNSQSGILKALDDVSFNVGSQKITALLGESGCGKTTLLNIISGLDNGFGGEIQFDNHVKPKIGYLFQTPSLLPWRTVWQNIIIGPEIFKQAIEEYKDRASKLLERYDLVQFSSAYPSSLSQGMQQRVSLIRLLLYGAELLLLDEAFSRIDPIFRRELYSDVTTLVDKELKTAVLVTHDVEEAVMLADKVIVLSPRPGHVLAEIEIPLGRSERLMSPLGSSDLLLPYFRRVWNALNEAKTLRR